MIFSHKFLALCATVMLSAVLGSIHAFSVFMPQWESIVGANRANVSLIYSIALVALTVSVLFGYRIYCVFSPVKLVLLVGVLAAMGLWVSAISHSILLLYFSYGVIFGGANGVGYGYALQLAGQAMPRTRGFAMGLVTAFYAVGATVTPTLFGKLIERGGNELALQTIAVLVFLTALVAAVFLKVSAIQFTGEVRSASTKLTSAKRRTRLLLWLAYGTSVTAGLMVLGHVYGIALWAQLASATAIWAVTLVAFGNMIGGFFVSFFADKVKRKWLLVGLPLVSALALSIMVVGVSLNALPVLFCLGIIGFSYGAIIAVYPVAVVEIFGANTSPRIYGQIFTAWGIAGVLGPWISGLLFDYTRSYAMGFVMAAVLSALSALVICSVRFNPPLD